MDLSYRASALKYNVTGTMNTFGIIRLSDEVLFEDCYHLAVEQTLDA